jgi:hypothetical protein
MKIQSYQLFAQLCEGLLNEASTGLDLVRTQPGGQEVIKSLHQNNSLSHEQEYKPIDKITWSQIKDSKFWVIIQGSKGVGAIKTSNGNYHAVASDGGEVKSQSGSRSDAITAFLKSVIGSFKKYHVGRDSGAARSLQSKRAQNKEVTSNTVDQNSLMKKFRPLWIRGVEAAIADIKGMVGIMIKNDAFSKAEAKIILLKKLESTLQDISTGSDSPGLIQNSVRAAIVMSAGHYYPELTGEIHRGRGYGGSNSYSSQNEEGAKKLLNDIAQGDTAKLGTILAFFKRSLIAS